MKVVCIYTGWIETSHGSSGDQNHLTIGKSYDTLNDERDWTGIGIKIKNDVGTYNHYNIVRFKKLDEIRNEKIETLLR